MGVDLSKVNLMVGLPCAGGMLHLETMRTLQELYNKGFDFTVNGIGNESIVSRARNTLLSEFYHSKEHTHLLFLDADVGIESGGVVKLLNMGKDVCGALVRLKTIDRVVYNTRRILANDGDYFKVENLGTACMLLSRKAVEDLVEEAKKIRTDESGKQYPLVYNRHSFVADVGGKDHYDVFRNGVFYFENDPQQIYYGEDYFVSHTLTQLGYEIWVDGTIVTTHSGSVTLSTNRELAARELRNYAMQK